MLGRCENCGAEGFEKLCGACGIPLLSKCPKCSSYVRVGANFCYACGYNLDQGCYRRKQGPREFRNIDANLSNIEINRISLNIKKNKVHEKITQELESVKGTPLKGYFCPLCGRYHIKFEETFRCERCWEVYLCKAHKVGNEYVCEVCARTDAHPQVGSDIRCSLDTRKPKIGGPETTNCGYYDDMVFVPEGEFLMGDDKRRVHVDAFYIDKYPVTNAKFKEFDPSHTFPPGRENYPATRYISWFVAKAYAEWVGKRLPTEEEWEKAARGTDGRIYPWGDEFYPKKCNTKESGILGYTPVDRFEGGRSPYGCYDMAGNALEWTDSWFDERKTFKVGKGGSWDDFDYVARCASRIGYEFFYRMTLLFGFRCAMSA